jgi:hypothetical protein
LNPRRITGANSWLAERVQSVTRNVGLPLTLHRVQFGLLTLVDIDTLPRSSNLTALEAAGNYSSSLPDSGAHKGMRGPNSETRTHLGIPTESLPT